MPYSWGRKIKFDIYGASHAPSVGIRISGIPAGEKIDASELSCFMLRRAPGQSEFTSKRCEKDLPVFLSGLTKDVTDGKEMVIDIENTDVRSSDYDPIKTIPRPGHADYAVRFKASGVADMRGGGRFSGRMTAPLCAAGGVCLQILKHRGIEICAHIASVYTVFDEAFEPMGESAECFEKLRKKSFPVKDDQKGERMKAAIRAAAAEGDSLGGTVECMITGVPAGFGGELLDGIESTVASLMFAVPAVKGVEFGAGFSAAGMYGSENNDEYCIREGRAVPASNNAGGILGGISTGMPILFRAAFKPVPSIAKTQKSVDLKTMEEVSLSVSGRHDPCILPRAVPIAEAVAAIAVLDILEGADE